MNDGAHSRTRYQRSEALLDRALASIPLGTQTFSKSITQFPRGAAPFYIAHAEGCRAWDVDDNEYIDFINDLAAVVLGYRDPDVDAAVRAQLESGVAFSLPHPLEIDVAETLIDMVPCAEMVRFGKNGSDVTAGAVRLARAYTGRDHVLVTGYHGWQDWYIGSTSRNRGVPEAVCALTHRCQYNDLDSIVAEFARLQGQVAALVMEPMNVVEPAPGFLKGLRELCNANNALLVFDEMITGFRFSSGGAQQRFGVTPDLACFGKGIANGYPLSALTGRAEIMQLLDELFFSFTHGSELVSLAAGLASMRKVRDFDVCDRLREQGGKVVDGVADCIERHNLGAVLSQSGDPSWSFLNFANSPRYDCWQLKTLYLQECFARGILTLGTHNMSYAHTDQDVQRLLEVYDEVFGILALACRRGDLEQRLNCRPLRPLFTVR